MRQKDLSWSRSPSKTRVSSELREARRERSSVGVVGRRVVPGASVLSSSHELLLALLRCSPNWREGEEVGRNTVTHTYTYCARHYI